MPSRLFTRHTSPRRTWSERHQTHPIALEGRVTRLDPSRLYSPLRDATDPIALEGSRTWRASARLNRTGLSPTSHLQNRVVF